MKKRLLSYLLTLSVLLAGSTVYYAADGETDITNPVNGTDINVSVDDYGTIIVPKNIEVTGGTQTLDYEITASGSVAGDHIVEISMPSSLELSQAGKDNITCTITENNTYDYFVDTDYNGSIQDISGDAPKLNGSDKLVYKIDTSDLSAGGWTGTLNITINIVDKVS